MILRIGEFDRLDRNRLMAVYAESNSENAEEFYPDEDRTLAVAKVEESFLGFLRDEFFAAPGSEYWILEEEGEWVSALRTSYLGDGLYYIEALETMPGYRRMGFAVKLLGGVIEELKKNGPFRICDCVNKGNEPSIRTHRRCGFRVASEAGSDRLRGDIRDWEYSFEYEYAGE